MESLFFELAKDLLHYKSEVGVYEKFAKIHCVSKNDNDVAHYNFNAHNPILVIFAQMLLSEYAIIWRFVIPPPLASVSALPGET